MSNFSQNWSNVGLITANDDWTGVPSIIGYLGDDASTTSAPYNPQTTLGAFTTQDVIANQSNVALTTGGVAEFAITNPVVALQGSATADAPNLVIYLNATGRHNILFTCNLRDIDGTADDVVQPIAFQYRIGAIGNFTNIPAAFVGDATTGPSIATLVTPVSIALPAACNNQSQVEIRIITGNATGSDEWVGIDDISVTSDAQSSTPTLSINDVSQVEGNAGTTIFTFNVTLSAPAGAGGVTFDIATADGTAQDDNPTSEDNDYVAQNLSGQTISAGSTGPYTFSVTVNGDGTTEPNETFFVNVTNIVGATAGDGQGQGTIQNDDVTLTPIHDIQGPGASSPIVGAGITTRGIVTGIKSNGFFIQEPDASIDADPTTSEGVLVFTSSAPPAAVVLGALVQVTGTVTEFVPSQDPLQPPLTELTSPTILQLSVGNPLPTPVPLTATFPDPAGTHNQLERVEGMRVSVVSLTVGGPTMGNINEPNATATSSGVFYGVITGVARPFREAGIQAPDPAPSGGGTIPPIPRFDSNPERIRVDSDGLVGASVINVSTNAIVSNLVGPLDYTFRTYTILPDPASQPSISGGATATAVTTPAESEFTVASYNLQRFFDTVNEPGIGEPVLTTAALNNRLNKASLGIRDFLKTPDIVGVVEMENLTTLQALAQQINNDAVAASQPNPQYVAYLQEGNDVGGIDVGFLVKTAPVAGATPRVTVNEVVQENKNEIFTNPDASTDLLNDRPPLRLNATINHANGASFPVTVIANHLRSLNDVNSEAAGSGGWPTTGARVRAKRQKQAESLANLVQARQTANPNERIILLGDFNAFEFNDGLGHSMGTIQGTPAPDNETAVANDGADLVNPDLVNLFNTTPAAERYSYVFDGNAQSLDHILVNEDVVNSTLARRVEHPRINADFPETDRNNSSTAIRLSDHEPVVSYYQVASFITTDLSITKTDGVSTAVPGGGVTYTITASNAGPNNAVGATITDMFPAILTGVTWTCVGSGGGTCTASGVGNINDIVNLPSGGSVTYTVSATILPSATNNLVNTAIITAPTSVTDPNSGNNSATDTDVLTPQADVSVTVTDSPDPVNAGTNLTYTITATNNGPSNAASVSFSNTLPAGTTFVSLTAPGGWSATTPAVGVGGTVSASITSLAAGTSAVFTLIVAVAPDIADGTVLSNTTTATSSTTDPNQGNESGTATTTVSNPCIITDYSLTGGGSYCNGGAGMPVGLSGSQMGFNYQLRLNGNPIGSPVTGTGMAVSFGNQTSAGTYTVIATKVIYANCNATMMGSVIVTINPVHTINLTSLPTTGSQVVCINAPITAITYTLGGGATGATVTGLPMGVTYGVSGNTLTISGSPSVTAGSPFNYNIITTGNACTTATESGTIAVNPLPTASISINGTAQVCQNAPFPQITFTGAGGTAPYTFTYQINGGIPQIISTTSGNSVSISQTTAVANTFVYTLVSVKDASSTQCSQTQNGTATITVNPLPTASISATPTAVCQNAPFPTVTFTGNGGTAPYTFTYKINGGADLTIVSSGNTAAISQTTAMAGVFEYTLVSVKDASSTQCSQTQNGTATITVHALPSLGTTPASLCTGLSINLSPSSGGNWVSSNPSIASVTNAGVVTGHAPGVVFFTFTETATGCSSTTANVTIKQTPSSNLEASKYDVCPNTEVTLTPNCSIPTSTLSWNPGAPTVTPDAATVPYIYRVKCMADGCVGNESSVEVRTHRILVDMKDLDVGALPLPIVRAVKDNMAPTNQITAPVFPRRWTFIANGCSSSESAEFKLSGPVNFNTVDNAVPYAMFANDGGGFYSLDHPNYGNGGSFPNGTYTLTIELRNQDGVGGPFPKNRIATGTLLAIRTLEFTIGNPASGRQGVSESTIDNENWVKVMPNPVTHLMRLQVLDLKGQEVKVNLLDATGRKVLQRSFVPETNQHQEEFEVSELSTGMYFLRVNTVDKQVTIKVLKIN